MTGTSDVQAWSVSLIPYNTLRKNTTQAETKTAAAAGEVT